MITSIDLIQAEDIKKAMQAWAFVSRKFSEFEGFENGQLVNIFRNLKVCENYALASICNWNSTEDWNHAKSAARRDPDVVRILRQSTAQFTGFTMNCVDGNEYNFSCNRSECIVLNVIHLESTCMPSYSEMWKRCDSFMSTQVGYLNAGLYQNQSLEDSVKFISIGEWNSSDSFLEAFHTDIFNEIVEPFNKETGFAFDLTNRVGLCTKGVSEGILL